MTKPRSRLVTVRSREFARSIVQFHKTLPRSRSAQVLGDQLLRSGTSVGATVHEARRSRSDSEMISKTHFALQELDETAYWLQLLTQVDGVQSDLLAPLLQEADELTAMLVASAKTLKARVAQKKRRQGERR